MKVLLNLLIPYSMLETMYDLILTFVTRAMRLPMLQLYEINQEIELCIFHIWYKKFCICIYINFDIFCASLNPCLSNSWLHNIRTSVFPQCNIPLPYIRLNVFPINSGILPSKKYIFIILVHYLKKYSNIITWCELQSLMEEFWPQLDRSLCQSHLFLPHFWNL